MTTATLIGRQLQALLASDSSPPHRPMVMSAALVAQCLDNGNSQGNSQAQHAAALATELKAFVDESDRRLWERLSESAKQLRSAIEHIAKVLTQCFGSSEHSNCDTNAFVPTTILDRSSISSLAEAINAAKDHRLQLTESSASINDNGTPHVQRHQHQHHNAGMDSAAIEDAQLALDELNRRCRPHAAAATGSSSSSGSSDNPNFALQSTLRRLIFTAITSDSQQQVERTDQGRFYYDLVSALNSSIERQCAILADTWKVAASGVVDAAMKRRQQAAPHKHKFTADADRLRLQHFPMLQPALASNSDNAPWMPRVLSDEADVLPPLLRQQQQHQHGSRQEVFCDDLRLLIVAAQLGRVVFGAQSKPVKDAEAWAANGVGLVRMSELGTALRKIDVLGGTTANSRTTRLTRLVRCVAAIRCCSGVVPLHVDDEQPSDVSDSNRQSQVNCLESQLAAFRREATACFDSMVSHVCVRVLQPLPDFVAVCRAPPLADETSSTVSSNANATTTDLSRSVSETSAAAAAVAVSGAATASATATVEEVAERACVSRGWSDRLDVAHDVIFAVRAALGDAEAVRSRCDKTTKRIVEDVVLAAAVQSADKVAIAATARSSNNNTDTDQQQQQQQRQHHAAAIRDAVCAVATVLCPLSVSRSAVSLLDPQDAVAAKTAVTQALEQFNSASGARLSGGLGYDADVGGHSHLLNMNLNRGVDAYEVRRLYAREIEAVLQQEQQQQEHHHSDPTVSLLKEALAAIRIDNGPFEAVQGREIEECLRQGDNNIARLVSRMIKLLHGGQLHRCFVSQAVARVVPPLDVELTVLEARVGSVKVLPADATKLAEATAAIAAFDRAVAGFLPLVDQSPLCPVPSFFRHCNGAVMDALHGLRLRRKQLDEKLGAFVQPVVKRPCDRGAGGGGGGDDDSADASEANDRSAAQAATPTVASGSTTVARSASHVSGVGRSTAILGSGAAPPPPRRRPTDQPQESPIDVPRASATAAQSASHVSGVGRSTAILGSGAAPPPPRRRTTDQPV